MSKFSELTPGRPSASKSKSAFMADLRDAEKKVRVNFELSESKHKKLKVHAARKGQSIKDFLTAYVDTLPDE